MKKLLKFTLLVTLLTNLLTAEILFDLNDQHFSNSLDGDGISAKYSLPNVYITTKLKYENDRYSLRYTDDASFDIELKNPLNDVRISFDMTYNFSTSSYAEVHNIQFIDVDGEVVTLGLSGVGRGFNFDGHLSDLSLDYAERVIGTITKNGSEFEININNGDLVRTYTVARFSRLKFIKFDVLYDSGKDILDGIIIGIDD